MIETIVIVPGLMVSFMIILTYLLPRENPIRLVFATTVMLTLIMFLNVVSFFLPINNEHCFMEATFFNLVVFVNYVMFHIVLVQNYV